MLDPGLVGLRSLNIHMCATLFHICVLHYPLDAGVSGLESACHWISCSGRLTSRLCMFNVNIVCWGVYILDVDLGTAWAGGGFWKN